MVRRFEDLGFQGQGFCVTCDCLMDSSWVQGLRNDVQSWKSSMTRVRIQKVLCKDNRAVHTCQKKTAHQDLDKCLKKCGRATTSSAILAHRLLGYVKVHEHEH